MFQSKSSVLKGFRNLYHLVKKDSVIPSRVCFWTSRNFSAEPEEEKPLLIFGLHGTILDSLCFVHSNIERAFLAANLPFNQSKVQTLEALGFGEQALIKYSLKEAGEGENDNVMSSLLRSYRAESARSEAFEECRPVAGAVDVLLELEGQGFRMAICTNQSQKSAEALLRHHGLRRFFAAVIGGDQLPVCKPHPGHMIAAAAAAGADQGPAIAVAAGLSALRAAHAAGMLSVAVAPPPPAGLSPAAAAAVAAAAAAAQGRAQPTLPPVPLGGLPDALLRLREQSTY